MRRSVATHLARASAKATRTTIDGAGTINSTNHAAPRHMWGLAPQTDDPSDLTVPLPHTEHPPDQAFPTYATRVTTLKNGLQVASADHNLPAATVGLYLHTGSAYEQISGTTHLLKHMAFKQSANYSQVSAFRALESIGAMPAVTPGRESCVYQLDTVREAVPHAVALLP